MLSVYISVLSVHFSVFSVYISVLSVFYVFHPPSIDVVHLGQGVRMFLSVDTWLLPAIAAGSSSYLVCLLWERFRTRTAPNGLLAGFLAGLSFVMGGISAYTRHSLFAVSLENNIIVMFFVGASTTFFWLLLRKYFPGFNNREKV